ncbi:unnamed protein product [Musa hybrid cultivar]
MIALPVYKGFLCNFLYASVDWVNPSLELQQAMQDKQVSIHIQVSKRCNSVYHK